MQTIETKYVGPTNYRGSRIIAQASGMNGAQGKVTISYDSALSSEDAHAAGAKALCAKMNWKGTLAGGHTKNGMVWVFVDMVESFYNFTV